MGFHSIMISAFASTILTYAFIIVGLILLFTGTTVLGIIFLLFGLSRLTVFKLE